MFENIDKICITRVKEGNTQQQHITCKEKANGFNKSVNNAICVRFIFQFSFTFVFIDTLQHAEEYHTDNCNRDEHSKDNTSCVLIDVLLAVKLVIYKQITHQHAEKYVQKRGTIFNCV